MALKLNFEQTQKNTKAPEVKVGFLDVAREVPGNLLQVGKDIAQGTLRGFGALGQQVLSVFGADKEVQPKGRLGRVLYGQDEPFSLETEGADLTRLVGVNPESRVGKLLNPIVGFGLTAIDAIPTGRPIKKGLIESTENWLKLIKSTPDDVVQSLVKSSTPKNVKQIFETRLYMPAKELGKAKIDADSLFKNIAKLSDETAIRKAISAEKKTFSKYLTKNLSAFRKASEKELLKRGDALIKQSDQIAKLPIKSRVLARVRPQEQLVSDPYEVLKNRVRALSAGARAGAKSSRDEVFNLQNTVVQQLKKDLPVSIRGKFITQIRNANTPAKMESALAKITDEAADFAKQATISAEKGKARSKFAFVKRMSKFQDLVVRDVKKVLDINKPISKMSKDELDSVYTELLRRSRIKRQSTTDAVARKGKLTREEYATAHQYTADTKPKRFSGFIEDVDKFVGTLSERTRKISPETLARLREFEMSTLLKKKQRQSAIKNWHNGTVDLAKKDPQLYSAIEKKKKNGDTQFIEESLKDAGLENLIKEYRVIRKTLDEIHTDLAKSGSNMGYLSGYMPRMVRPDKYDDFLSTISNTPFGSDVEKAIAERASRLGIPIHELDKEERVKIINTLLRGFKTQGVALSAPKQTKTRLIDVLTPEINQYYEAGENALPKYIETMTDYIEARKLFGKVDKNLVSQDFSIDSSIGALVEKLRIEKKIDIKEADELQSILYARFNQKQMSPWLTDVKNIGYIGIMGQPANAITQIGDLYSATYNAGLIPALKSTVRALFGKTKLTADDLGLESVAREYVDGQGKINTGKWVSKVFNTIGLKFTDNIGKNAFIESAFDSAQSRLIRGDKKTRQEFVEMFGERADEVIDKIKNGIIDDDGKQYAFNKLSDFQPITDLEVPEKYLTAGNGKVFYMLQTWTIRQLNVYRREAFAKMAKGTKRDFLEGSKNLVEITALMTLFGATAMEVKDFIRGKEKPFSENVVDSLIQASGVFNRYTLDKGTREGTLLQDAIVPGVPALQPIDNVLGDINKVSKQFNDSDKSFDINKLRTIRNIPVGGDLYYWWFGPGVKRKNTTNGQGGSGLKLNF